MVRMYNLSGFLRIVKGNEEVDLLAKQSLKFQTIDLQVKLGKAEAKTIIKAHAQNL